MATQASAYTSPGTRVTYNDVVLNNVTTRQWREELVYDPSGTDLMFKKYHLEFSAFVSRASAAYTGVGQYGPWANAPGASASTTAPALMQEVRKRLLTPRKNLAVTVNGKALLTCYASTQLRFAERDVNHGPHPVDLQITQISSDTLFRVTFVIECSKLECVGTSPGDSVPQVLSNRWSVVEELDDNFFVTKIFRGRIRLSQNIDVDPHLVKHVTIPPLETGFARKRVSLLAEPNGLEAAYEVIDRQVDMAAPWPATQIVGSHSYSTGDGHRFHAECRLRLTGAPNCDKGLLVARAVQCLDSRLNLVNRAFGAGENQWCFTEGGFQIALHFGPIAAVEIYARIMEGMPSQGQADSKRYYFNQIPESLLKPWKLEPFRKTTGIGSQKYDPAASWAPETYGYVPDKKDSHKARSAAAAFTKRCLATDLCADGPHSLAASGKEGYVNASKVGGGATKYSEESGAIPADYSSSPKQVVVSSGAKSSIYTYCTAETTYVTHRGKIQLPKAPATTQNAQQAALQETCFVATVASPVCYRIVKLDAERVGQWPNLPEPVETYTDGKDNTITATLIDTVVRPHPPTPAADASRGVYRIAATYIYALSRPPTLTEQIQVGVQPTMDSSSREIAKLPQAEVFSDYVEP